MKAAFVKRSHTSSASTVPSIMSSQKKRVLLCGIWFCSPSFERRSSKHFVKRDTGRIFATSRTGNSMVLPSAALEYYMQTRWKDCAVRFEIKFGANISRVTQNTVGFLVEGVNKPLCIEESNKIENVDFAGSPMSTYFAGFRGLLKLKYLNVENTHINSLENDFLHYLPALEVLKLGKRISNILLHRLTATFLLPVTL